MKNFHSKQFELFKKMRDNDTLAHAFLLTGPQGVGKHSFALSAAKFIQETEDIANNPDIIETSSPLPIKEAKELKKRLAVSPYSAKQKIVIINEADRMHTDAANSLLKMIEEPRGGTVFFLVSSHPQLILKTIQSRCYEVKFFLVPDEEIAKELDTKKIEGLKAHWTGRPAIAEKLLNDNEYYRKIEEYKEDCISFLNGDLAKRFKIAEKYAKIKEDSYAPEEMLRIWIEHVREGNFPNKEELIKHLFKLYKDITTTNANFNYLFNSFSINTYTKI